MPVATSIADESVVYSNGHTPREMFEKEDEALVREVKANLAHLHRKLDIMSTQVNRKLDSIITWGDGSCTWRSNGTNDCTANGKSNGTKQAGAISGKHGPQPPLPLPAASFLASVPQPDDLGNSDFEADISIGPSASGQDAVSVYKSRQSVRTSPEAEIIGEETKFDHVVGKRKGSMLSGAKQLTYDSKNLGSQPGFSQLLHASSAMDAANKNRRMKWHHRILNFLEEPDSSPAAFVYSKVMSGAILCSCLLNFAQTVKPPPLNPDVFVPIEMLFDAFFLGEVSVRFAATPNKIGFFTSIHNVIDVVSSGPPLILRAITQYTPYKSADPAEEIRYVILCISPVFRMLKMLRRWNKFHLLMYSGFTLVSEVMPVLLVILFILAFIFASMIYFVEPRENIEALPKALWFTIITMSTVGYGDTVPSTTTGNIITLVLVICSALYMAVPLGIAGNAFSKVWDDRDWLQLIQHMRDRLTLNNYHASDIPNMFRSFGNDNGEISLDDFVRMISEMGLGIREDRILDLFFSFDSDNSGTIDAMEFIRAIFPSQFVRMYGRKSQQYSRDRSSNSTASNDGSHRRSVASRKSRASAPISRGSLVEYASLQKSSTAASLNAVMFARRGSAPATPLEERRADKKYEVSRPFVGDTERKEQTETFNV